MSGPEASVDGPEAAMTVAHNQGLSPTGKFQLEDVKGPLLHKDPMTSKLLDHNEKLFSVATL